MPTTASRAPSGLRERNRLDKRQRIREATRELFSAQGFEATTLRQIAERAQVGLGTLFHYAQDKRDLTFLLFNDDLARLVDEAVTASARETRILERVMAIWEPHYRYFAQDPALCRILLRDMYFYVGGGEAQRFNDTTTRLRAHLTDVIATGREQGRLTRSAATADMSALLFSAFASSVRAWLLEETPVASAGLATLRRRVKLLLRAFVSTRGQAVKARPSQADARAGNKGLGRTRRLAGGTQ